MIDPFRRMASKNSPSIRCRSALPPAATSPRSVTPSRSAIPAAPSCSAIPFRSAIPVTSSCFAIPCLPPTCSAIAIAVASAAPSLRPARPPVPAVLQHVTPAIAQPVRNPDI